MKYLFTSSIILVWIASLLTLVSAELPANCSQTPGFTDWCVSGTNRIIVPGAPTNGCPILGTIEKCVDLCNSKPYQAPNNPCKSIQYFNQSASLVPSGSCCLHNASVTTVAADPGNCPRTFLWDFPCTQNSTCEEIVELRGECTPGSQNIAVRNPTFSVQECREHCANTVNLGLAKCNAFQYYDRPGTNFRACVLLRSDAKTAVMGNPSPKACNMAKFFNFPCGTGTCVANVPNNGKCLNQNLECTYTETSVQGCRDRCFDSELPCYSFQYTPAGPNAGTCCIQRTNIASALDPVALCPNATAYEYPCTILASTSTTAKYQTVTSSIVSLRTTTQPASTITTTQQASTVTTTQLASTNTVTTTQLASTVTTTQLASTNTVTTTQLASTVTTTQLASTNTVTTTQPASTATVTTTATTVLTSTCPLPGTTTVTLAGTSTCAPATTVTMVSST